MSVKRFDVNLPNMQRSLSTPSGEVLATDVSWANSPRARLKGLLGSHVLAEGRALVIVPARQVHTFGMRYPIDVVFCDREWRVLRLIRRLPPRRVTRWVRRARYVVELPAGAIPDEIAAGVQLVVR